MKSWRSFRYQENVWRYSTYQHEITERFENEKEAAPVLDAPWSQASIDEILEKFQISRKSMGGRYLMYQCEITECFE
jgi:hypothetical protein